MSHFVAVVILPEDVGPTAITEEELESQIDALIERYDENIDVDPYFVEMTPGRLQEMGEYYKIDPGDLDALAAKMPEWNSHEAVSDFGKFGYLSTYNPQSKFDWWVIGGRWNGFLNREEQTNVCKVRDHKMPYAARAIITPDGEWHEKGRMGWFGMSFDDKEQDKWDAEFYEILSAYPENYIVVVDCHV